MQQSTAKFIREGPDVALTACIMSVKGAGVGPWVPEAQMAAAAVAPLVAYRLVLYRTCISAIHVCHVLSRQMTLDGMEQ